MSDYMANFLKPKNLESISNLLLNEANLRKSRWALGMPLSGAHFETIRGKKCLESLLNEEIKPAFYEITRTKPVKDPKIYVKAKSEFGSRMQMAYHSIIKPFSGYAAAFALLFGATFSSAFPLPESIIAGSSFFAATELSTAMIGYAKSGKHSNSEGLYCPPSKIILKDNKRLDSTLFTMAHEYSHHYRHKKKLNTMDDFVEEGIATAISLKVLEKLSENDIHFGVYASLYMVSSLAASAFAICHANGIPFNTFNIDLGSISPECVSNALSVPDYTLGAMMVRAAEQKHGPAVYEELFRGNDKVLMDI